VKPPLRFAAGLLMAVVAAEVHARAETIVVSPAGPQRSIGAAVRAAAARSLGAMKEAAAGVAPALMALLRDGDEGVRAAAADALGRVGRWARGASAS